MATANALLTVDEFLKLLEHDGERVELVQGEVVTVAAAGFPHERLKARVTRLLNVWLAQNPLGEVFSETMYRLDEHSSLQPDVSVLLNERIRPGIEGLYPERRISPSRSCPRKRPPICRTRSTSTWSMGAGPCGCSIPSRRGSWFTARAAWSLNCAETRFWQIPTCYPASALPSARSLRGCRYTLDRRDLYLRRFASADRHRKSRDAAPSVARAPLDAVRLTGGIRAQAPVRVRRAVPPLHQLDDPLASLAQHPRLARIGRFIQLVWAGFVCPAAIDYEVALGSRAELEFDDGAELRLREDRVRLPHLAAIGSDQQKRIARQGMLHFAADPAVFEIDELDAIEARQTHAFVRLAPCLAGIVAGQQH